MVQNAVMFKQFIENKSLDYCQIDSCRIASINEILPVLLIASKFDIPIIPHAGGVGLCEYVQHLNLINKFIITNNSLSLSEYAESCSEHFVNPALINNGGYVTPTIPGYSVIIKDSSIKEFDYNIGTYWN
jgi:L-fuconate dehydratase